MSQNEKKDDMLYTLYQSITQHLLEDERPSIFLNEIANLEHFQQYPFLMLKRLQVTEQSKQHHPEGNVWNHTMLVLDEAAKVKDKSKDVRAFMWAALLHDIGKPETTRHKNGRITAYDHDSAGEKLCYKFFEFFEEEDEFIETVAALVRYHMHMLYVMKNLPFADLKGLAKRTDPNEVALLCLCDRRGRVGVEHQSLNQEYNKFVNLLTKTKAR